MKQARIGLLVMAAMIAAPSFAPRAEEETRREACSRGCRPRPRSAPPRRRRRRRRKAPPATGRPRSTPTRLPGGQHRRRPGSRRASLHLSRGDLGDICKIDPAACPTMNLDEEAKRDHAKSRCTRCSRSTRSAYRRFELNPYWSVTLNDQFVSHPGPVARAQLLHHERARGRRQRQLTSVQRDSDFNFQTRRAARVGRAAHRVPVERGR